MAEKSGLLIGNQPDKVLELSQQLSPGTLERLPRHQLDVALAKHRIHAFLPELVDLAELCGYTS